MNRAEQIEQTLKRIMDLKDSIDFKEIEEYLLNKESDSYYFNEVDSDDKLETSNYRKFILKSNTSSFIKPQELNKDKPLYNEINKLINDFLGIDYLLIVFFDVNDRYVTDEDAELFSLIFKKIFLLNKSGKITINRIESCEKAIAIGEVKKVDSHKISIDVDMVYKSSLKYLGDTLQNENILFYGYNIEENPYLVELFKNSSPNKILNIIPISSNNSFFDNVD